MALHRPKISPGVASRSKSNQRPMPDEQCRGPFANPGFSHGAEGGQPGRIARSVALENRFDEDHDAEHPAQKARHQGGRQEDPQELADQELAARHRFAHHGDGGAAFDFFGDRHAGRQHREQHAGHHDRVEAELLDHLGVFAEREIRDDDGDEHEEGCRWR